MPWGPVRANFRFTLGVSIKVRSKSGGPKGHSRKLRDQPWLPPIQKARKAVLLTQGQRPCEELQKGQARGSQPSAALDRLGPVLLPQSEEVSEAVRDLLWSSNASWQEV